MRGVKVALVRLGFIQHGLLHFGFVSLTMGQLQWVCGVESDSLKMTQKRGSADPACFFPASRAVTSFL